MRSMTDDELREFLTNLLENLVNSEVSRGSEEKKGAIRRDGGRALNITIRVNVLMDLFKGSHNIEEINRVYRAWTVTGVAPQIHWNHQKRLRESWPTLANALDRLTAPKISPTEIMKDNLQYSTDETIVKKK
jgi:hypothetical protein